MRGLARHSAVLMISVAVFSMFNADFVGPALMAGAPWFSPIFLTKAAAAAEPSAPGTVQNAATDTQSATWHVFATRGANRYRVVEVSQTFGRRSPWGSR